VTVLRTAYVHIPFCAKKCGYCDFNAYSGYKEGTKTRYVEALCREIAVRAEQQTRVPTVFFGGGTPTTLSAAELGRILAAVRASFAVDADAEVSVEANPCDATPEYLAELRAAGFNRLSFGVQTFDDRLLKTIDRVHTGAEARTAVAMAKAVGFTSLSIDLMFGLPRQTLADWERALDAALALDVPHLSMYGLIVEEGTPFYARRERGKLPLPSEKVEAAMFGRAVERATAAGYEHYEISNYAKPGHRSRHNQVYWRNEEYFGFGAGAASYLGGVRSTNVRRPSAYNETVNGGDGTAFDESERLEDRDAMGETVMVGLRLTEGVDLERFARRFGVRAEQVFAPEIARLTERGLVEVASGRLRLTRPTGLFLASEAMAEFV
jgi:oxygen-independent coproporphyrinogen-3 oxidase